jgi:hypothetical protein
LCQDGTVAMMPRGRSFQLHYNLLGSQWYMWLLLTERLYGA